MRRHRAMKVNDRFDRLSRNLEARQFSQQHRFVFEDQRNGKMNVELSGVYQGEQSKRTPTSRTQPSYENISIDHNLRCGHWDMLNKAALEGNVVCQGKPTARGHREQPKWGLSRSVKTASGWRCGGT